MPKTSRRFGFSARFARTQAHQSLDGRRPGDECTQYVPKQEQGIVRSEASDRIPLDVVLPERACVYDFLVKFILPLLMTHGLLLLGMPGVGKTPFVITMALAYGRYHVREQGLTAPAGWRRAKALDNFQATSAAGPRSDFPRRSPKGSRERLGSQKLHYGR